MIIIPALYNLSMILAGAALLQSLVFAALLTTKRFRQSTSNLFLFIILLLMVAIKADELFQLTGLLESHPAWAFILAPLQALMTPALYFFVRARIDGEFQLQRSQAWHLLPFLIYSLFWWWSWFRFPLAERLNMLDGAVSDGDSLIAENNYGYGAPVHAAADGEVVFVNADETQDRRAQWILPGETMDEARERVGNMNMQRVMEDFQGALAGNLITIRHVGEEGSVEYSNYAHLKASSVRVKLGQIVKVGEVIGEVGDTGDSSAVHLHFQINEGPDAFFSRSKPISFINLEESYEGQDPGLFVHGK